MVNVDEAIIAKYEYCGEHFIMCEKEIGGDINI